MNLLTIIVLLILLFFVLNGYRRGFIKTLVSMVSIAAAVILVSIATPYVSQFLKSNTPVYGIILEKCQDTFAMDAGGAGHDTSAGNGTDRGAGSTDRDADVSGQDRGTGDLASGQDRGTGDLASGQDRGTGDLASGQDRDVDDLASDQDDELSRLEQAKFIEGLKLPKAIQDMLEGNNNKTGYEKLEVQAFTDYIPNYMATLILNMISFVATFLLVISFLWIAVMTLDVIANLPVLHGINRILGLAIGLFQGLIFVWLAFLVITVFSNTDFGRQLMILIYESPILNIIYDNNIFLKLLTEVVSYFA